MPKAIQSLTTLGFAVLAGALDALIIVAPAHASLIADGITYTLTETATANPLVANFDLTISGINSASDTEGGRSGVNAIAFTKPANFSTAAMTAPSSGFNLVVGGLNSSGCNGSGNFFCFDNTAIPPTPATPFPANSSLDFAFSVTLSSGSFTGYDPDFKIDWVGSKNNYDLVSQGLVPTPGDAPPPSDVPEPASLGLLGAALAGVGFLHRRRKSV